MKKGFTLTEILIAMGIIGVVAALAVPNISAKINRNTIGVTLARAVELTETGFASMMNVARENAASVANVAGGEQLIDPGSISTISVLQERFFDGDMQNIRETLDWGMLMSRAQSYIGIDIINNNNVGGYLNNIPNRSNNTRVARFKKVNAYLILDDDAANDNNITDNPDVVIRRIYFDVNGANNPNRLGEDIFLFGLTDSGHLVPAGSAAYNNNIWNVNGDNDIAMNCDGDTIPNGNDANDNDMRLSCAARVVQDGWRVNYSF